MAVGMPRLPRSGPDARHDMWDAGYRLTVAEITVRPRRGGEPCQLVWQDLDRSPDFPVLSAFLKDLPERGDCIINTTKVTICDTVTPEDLACQSISLGRH
jgi:uncharacterized protein Usg